LKRRRLRAATATAAVNFNHTSPALRRLRCLKTKPCCGCLLGLRSPLFRRLWDSSIPKSSSLPSSFDAEFCSGSQERRHFARASRRLVALPRCMFNHGRMIVTRKKKVTLNTETTLNSPDLLLEFWFLRPVSLNRTGWTKARQMGWA
jgi:hypothetical protein